MERGETRDEQIRGEIVRVVCFEPMQRLIIVYIYRISRELFLSRRICPFIRISRNGPPPLKLNQTEIYFYNVGKFARNSIFFSSLSFKFEISSFIHLGFFKTFLCLASFHIFLA